MKFRPFAESREYVHKLGLKSKTEWIQQYCKSGNKAPDIPSNPQKAYKDEWKGYGDWLDTGAIATKDIPYRPFEEARQFVHKLGLKSETDWREYYKSDKKPNDIPVDPRQVYE